MSQSIDSASSVDAEAKPYAGSSESPHPVDQESDLKRILTENKGVQLIISRLQEDAGVLGPLEQGYDVEKVLTRPDPHSDFHPEDEWKYPVDMETKLRLVEFVPGDKGNPKNMGTGRKWLLTVSLGMICFVVALGSAIVTGDLAGPVEYFKVSQEVVILSSVTVFVVGFGVGPLLFAPMSEELGRSIIYAVTLGMAVIFIIPCAVAKNIGTLMICRLIDGVLFSAPMTLIGGSLADIWDANERGKAMAVFSAAPFLGPCLGPIFGGLLGDYTSTWRWVYWAYLIIAGVFYILFLLIVPETHHNTLLKRRAAKLRKLTGDESYRCLAELQVRSDRKSVV